MFVCAILSGLDGTSAVVDVSMVGNPYIFTGRSCEPEIYLSNW